MDSAGGAMRSNPRRSARRTSPYGPPPGPLTTGLSGAIGDLSVVSAKRKSPPLRKSPPRKSPSRKAPIRQGAFTDLMAATGPLARQEQKEAEWKAKLAREKTSWWDAAALAVTDGTVSGSADPARSSSLRDASSSSAPATLHESASQVALRTLARGRNHARADMKSVEQWRREAVDKFLGETPAPPSVKPLPPTSTEPEHSPGHFDRRYGRRQRLPPLGNRRSQLASASVASEARTRQTLSARQRAFVPPPS